VSKKALSVLVVACLFCMGFAFDPLPGNWRCIYQAWGATDRIGAVMHVDFDTASSSYLGQFVAVTDSMKAVGWTIGNYGYLALTYEAVIAGDSDTLYGYDGVVVTHHRKQVTPDVTGYDVEDYLIELQVSHQPGYVKPVEGHPYYFSVICKEEGRMTGSYQETWVKVE